MSPFARAFEPEDGVLVADVGGGEFDHHQADAALRPDGHKRAACGLVFDAFWQELYPSEAFYRAFLERYIVPIEDADNGYARNPLSAYISGMNPEWDEGRTADECFHEAVSFMEGLIRQEIRHFEAVDRAKAIVGAAPVVDGVLCLPVFCPWQDAVMGRPELKYVLFPSNRGGWNVQVIPDAPGSFGSRVPFPETLTPDTEGCTFVHANRFLAAFETREAALAALR